jgi:hypothetical protein
VEAFSPTQISCFRRKGGKGRRREEGGRETNVYRARDHTHPSGREKCTLEWEKWKTILEGHMGPDHADVRKSSQEGFLLLLFYLF